MSVFLCRPCKITIIDNRKGVIPACPSCGKPTVPKAGPGAIEEQFPEKSPDDTVFQLDLQNLPPVIDPIKPPEPPEKKK